MTVFKYFFKIMKEYKFTIILYTAILVFFGAFNITTSDTSMNFIASKPDVLIINNDGQNQITENLCKYIENNANIKEIENEPDKIKDALFYRDVNYIVIIPENYESNFLKGENPIIEVKSTKDANASYMEMLLKRYLKVANIYSKEYSNKEELINKINSVLITSSNIEVTSKIKTNGLDKLSVYYNFANYSILAGCVFVISTILNSFKNEKINKRITISSSNYKKYNRELFLGGITFGTVLWLLYIVISFILMPDAMFSIYGIFYLLNSAVFMLCALSIAFLIGNLINSKEAINGIVNVIALGSSFLCGAFVPIEYLPNAVLNIARILPSYWFIQNNEFIKGIETFNFNNLTSFFINLAVVILFIIIFVILTNIVTKKKRKFN